MYIAEEDQARTVTSAGGLLSPITMVLVTS
jgi:hypothetical protein